jgi:phenylacetate-CoA ligase
MRDRLLGYRRISAYDLDESALRRAAAQLLEFRPQYVIGYSVALHMMAEANAHLADQFRSLRLKAVIATAEAFPGPGCRESVESTFGCPVALEYGCVECGVLAHTAPGSGFRTFWHSHLIEAVADGVGHAVVVTSLFPRSMPLFRYRLGDRIDAGLPDGTSSESVLRFEQLLGRSNDSVTLPSGRVIHSEAFTHAIRSISGVAAFQVIRRPGRNPSVRVVCRGQPSDGLVDELRSRLARLAPELGSIEVLFSASLRQSVAGKRPMVIDDDRIG